MALLLKDGAIFKTNTGYNCETAYLKISPIGQNNKDTQVQEMVVSIYNSKNDRKKIPLLSTHILISGEDYNKFFSPLALMTKSIYVGAYEYILLMCKKSQEDIDALASSNDSDLTLRYEYFSWLQGDIWVSDEV